MDQVAAEAGTPTYVYSAATLGRHYRVFADAFDGADALIAFSVKANPNIAVLETLAELGAGADVVSGGELRKALAAGVPPERIVFSGVGKTRDELADAVRVGLRLINVESEAELAALDAAATAQGRTAPIALRVNPDVAAGGHDKITTGRAEDKFGIPWARARAVYAQAAASPGVDPIGVDVHIGSQIEALAPFQAAARRVRELIAALRADGRAITVADVGGGLAIPYRTDGTPPPGPAAYAQALRAELDPVDVAYIAEPGRLIAGNAGLLLTRVTYIKDGAAKRFAVLDAGMNDLMRPALYDAHHEIWPVRAAPADRALETIDVVGPVCESSDVFARARPLAPLAAGDLVAIMSAGAYGAAQAGDYNQRPRAAEVLVRGGDYALVRPRPSYTDMFAAERRAPWSTRGALRDPLADAR